MSAPRCTRPFGALWCMAVLATHRSCFRAVVDDVAETRTTHALPALAQRNPSGSAPALRRCSSRLGMTDAHWRVSHHQLHFSFRFSQHPGARNVPRGYEERGPRNEEID